MKIHDTQIEYIEFINREVPTSQYHVTRKSFVCLEVVVIPQSDFGQKVFSAAKEIQPKLNSGRAPNSTKRDDDTIEVDNLSGVLAEMVCAAVLKHRYGDAISKDNSTVAVNQIDIRISNGKTVEVRSSCIYNGIKFALFSKRKGTTDNQNANLVGPYATAYKPGEICKDYYMGVIFPFSIDFFMEQWNQNKPIKMYITGGATKNMMQDHNIYQIKHLTPENEPSVTEESDYHVIPFAKSLDILEFFAEFENENRNIKILNGFLEEDSSVCAICHSNVSDEISKNSKQQSGRVLCELCQKRVQKWREARAAKKGERK